MAPASGAQEAFPLVIGAAKEAGIGSRKFPESVGQYTLTTRYKVTLHGVAPVMLSHASMACASVVTAVWLLGVLCTAVADQTGTTRPFAGALLVNVSN